MTGSTQITKTDGTRIAEQRDIWPDILRIVAVFAVVVLHTGVEHFYRIDTRTATWQICNLCESLGRFCVPVFIMVSGHFLLDPDREYTLKKLYGVKILRLATAYLFWSVFYVLTDYWFALKYGHDVKLTCSVFFREAVAGKYHLWFLPMMAGLYMVTPVLRHIVRSETVTVYFLALSLVFVFAVNTLDLIPVFHDTVTPEIERLDFKLAAGFSGYYVLGFWLARHELKPAARKGVYLAGILAALATAAINGAIGYQLHRPGEWMFGTLILNTLLASAAVFVFCRYQFRDWRPGPGVRKLTGLLEKWSFGIYLVHLFVLAYFNYILIRLDVFSFVCAHPLVSIPVASAAVFSVSALFVSVLSRIPILNKYIV